MSTPVDAPGAADPSAPGFRVDVDQNPHLPVGSGRVDAVVTVRGDGGADGGAAPDRVELLLVDCSGSMQYPMDKMREAVRATVAAIDTLADGVAFAVVAGTERARMCFPADRVGTVRADAASRAAAARAVRGLVPDGGTAIGTWLTLARALAEQHPGAVRHAILLTDGRNEHEEPGGLERAVAACAGVLTCDARGVGTDWEVAELRVVADGLLGTVDIVADPADLAADFAAMARASMGKTRAEVVLRLWTPAGAAVRFLKQVAPEVADLTARRVASGERTGDYPLGAWGEEERDYHLAVDVPPGEVGREKLAARVVVLSGESVLGQGLVRASWTDDGALSARISRRVAHYTGQAELADAIAAGLAARKDGDVATATARLGRAAVLAAESGNDATARLLARVVEVDEETGTARLRAGVAAADEMALDARSTKTARVQRPG